MKKNVLPAILISAAAFVSTASANIVSLYSSGTGVNQFNTNAGYFDRGDSLDGTPIGAAPANQWQTTDPFNGTDGATSQLNFVPGYTGGEGPSGSDAGNNSVYWGGYGRDFSPPNGPILPGSTNPSLYYTVSQPFSTASAENALLSTTFTSDFALFPSTSGPNDTFGFSFWTAGRGSLLAQVQFLYNTSSNLFIGSLNGTQVVSVAPGSIYSLQGVFDNTDTFTLSMAGVTADTDGFGVVTNYTRGAYVSLGSPVSLAPGSTDAFETASIDWELASGNPAVTGDNYMIINSVQIESVVTPEPATVLAGVFLAGVTAYTTIRRRRQAKVAATA